ncbi:MAG: polysaccharide pyruvyl transferase family protein [Verrucomicrobiota bacterium]
MNGLSSRSFSKSFLDRRSRFYDLRRVAPSKRHPRSPVLQFYSSSNNIGNFLPVLGIRKMLGLDPDTWCIHDREIDFEFVNRNYRSIIIGGAGLFHPCFAPFWENLLKNCKVPMIIWGVGGCFLDGKKDSEVCRRTIAEAGKRCDLINVRDDISADFFQLSGAHLSACPTLAYLEGLKVSRNGPVLFSSHEKLVSDTETEEIRAMLQQLGKRFKYTTNEQSRFHGLDDIILQDYGVSSIVVTTRLHGAIIAYALGIPYVALPRDEKLRAFGRLYGNGILVEEVRELRDALLNISSQTMSPIALSAVHEFGTLAKDWVLAHQ